MAYLTPSWCIDPRTVTPDLRDTEYRLFARELDIQQGLLLVGLSLAHLYSLDIIADRQGWAMLFGPAPQPVHARGVVKDARRPRQFEFALLLELMPPSDDVLDATGRPYSCLSMTRDGGWIGKILYISPDEWATQIVPMFMPLGGGDGPQ